MSMSEHGRAESIRQRLRNLVRERGEDVQFAIQRYAIERFLYRLGISGYRDRFVLKGATLFALWGGAVYRPTRDLDFTGFGSYDETDILNALRDICRHSGETDELVFDADSLTAEQIRDDSEYQGLRIRFEQGSANRAYRFRSISGSALLRSGGASILLVPHVCSCEARGVCSRRKPKYDQPPDSHPVTALSIPVSA